MLLPEIVAAGIYNSQIAAKNIKISKNRKTTMFEIELPIESGGISYLNSNSMPITPDMIICAKPGQTRHTAFPFKCYYIHIILHDGSLYDTLINTPDFIKTDKVDVYREIFKKIVKYYNTFNKNDEIILQSLLLELIYTISGDKSQSFKSQNSKTNNNHLMIETALDYIKNNLTEPLNLNEIAEIVHLSPIHFHNCFKVSVGKTLRDYVEEQRLKKAIKLLLTTDYSLTKIAFECGFSSQSYFSYVFKRKMNKTPREYAQEIYNRYEL